MSSQNRTTPYLNTNQSQLYDQQHFNSIDHAGNNLTMARTSRIVDLSVHGVIGFLSVYAFGSIIAAMQSQSPVGSTSSSAVFLFIVTGVSFIISLVYFGFGWWSQSSRGAEQISRLANQQNFNYEAATKEAQLPPPSKSVRIIALLTSTRPRLWIQTTLAVLCIIAASVVANNIGDPWHCSSTLAVYHHFCSTSKAAVVSTFISGFCWMAWAGWSLFKSRQNSASSGTTDVESIQNGEVLISMPDENRVAEMSPVSTGVSRGSVGPALNQLVSDSPNNRNQSRSNASLPASKYQQHTTLAMSSTKSGSDNSLGLGIDIGTKNSSGVKSENEDVGNSSFVNPDHQNKGSVNRFHQNSVSLSGINQITGPIPNGRSRSNSIRSVGTQSTTNINTRLRDHAKVFQAPRSRAASIYEGSDRGTPIFPPGSTFSIHRQNMSISSNVSTPTTPLTRGEMGYMGAHTIKALNSVPRSFSMSQIAARNSMNASIAGSAAPSAHTSPNPGMNNGAYQGGFDLIGTPVSARSLFGPGSFGFQPQTAAEAEAAELSMDEHLKAIRRRSVAAEIINSPGGIDGESGAPSPTGSSHGSFRVSFSSPNLNSFRRRSSLGLKSVLNSVVPSIARSGSSSSISSSEASSPQSSTSPRELDSINGADGRLSLEAQGNPDALSADELLRSEYGDLFSQKSIADLTLNNPQSSDPVDLANDQSVNQGIHRPRSSSVSSDSTTRTSSSGYSDSTSSTISNMTSLSVDEKRAARAAGPPRAFLNRLNIGHHKKSAQQSQQLKFPSKGSNGNVNEITVTIPRSASADLKSFSWDYRREMPVD